YFAELKELMNLKGVARRDSVNDKIYIPADAKELPPPEMKGINPTTLPGIVIDDSLAKTTGDWKGGEGLKNYIGKQYRYLGAKEKGSARFEINVPTTGSYEVRYAYQPHENRASNAPITVHSADGDKAMRINERKDPPIAPTFISLGVFRFEAGKP